MFKQQSLAELKANILHKINEEKLGSYAIHTEHLLGTSDLNNVRYPQCDVILNKFFDDLKSEGYRISKPQPDEVGATYIIYGKPLQSITQVYSVPNSSKKLTIRTDVYLMNSLTLYIITNEDNVAVEYTTYRDALLNLNNHQQS